MADELNKKNLFETIKTGQLWHAQRIKDEIHAEILSKYSFLGLSLRKDDLGAYYILNTDCCLSIENSKIEIRNERENTMSAGKVFLIEVNSKADIEQALAFFVSMTMEGEDDE